VSGMQTARSKDGTAIAFDRLGEGPPIVLVGGAFSYRRFSKMVQLAKLLSGRFTVVNYDRRGRGDSGDSGRYAVEREIEDLQAVIEAVGGSASVWGWSSGGVLGMRAAAGGVNIDRLAVYEPPFLVDDSGPLPPADFGQRLGEVTAADRRGEAVKLFMTKGMGVPAAIVTMMRLSPFWSKLKATANTLPYEWTLVKDITTGRPPTAAAWADVKVPTLVMAGQKTAPQLRNGAKAIADALPNAHHLEVPKLSHNVSMKAIAPLLTEYFGAAADSMPVTATPARNAST